MLTDEQVLAAIRKGGGIDGAKSIDIDEEFESLGIDSLDVFNVLLEIEALTGIKVPDADVEKLTSARAVLNYFNSKT